MHEEEFHYVFGPVVSRRLGKSLGVDPVPFKTCTYDCVYCQLGRTTHRTGEVKPYVPLEAILGEIRSKVAHGVSADFITIAGSGEPTLYADLGALVRGIKDLTDTPVCVLTNGATLGEPGVRDALLLADVVVPSLDAGDAETFSRVNRPCASITFDRMIEGLVDFRGHYRGQLWLEVFLLHGVTDTPASLDKIAAIIERVRPDRIQLNTVARPTPGGEALPVPRETLEAFAVRLGPHAEIVAKHEPARHETGASAGPDDLLGVIQRHPCTLDDLAEGLGISKDKAMAHVAELLARKAVLTDVRGSETYYLAARRRA